jgi:putative ABC transport system substrate-binding protein
MLLTLSFPAEAQQPKKVPRIGFLSANSPSSTKETVEGFRRGLRELGYVEGKTITVEYRYAEGKLDRLPDLAAELVRLKVDVIFTAGTLATMALKGATTTIPIVITGGTDPVATGVVASLARPGGNITGVTVMNAELAGKRLELLKETSPKVSRVAVLWNSTNSGTAVVFNQTKAATQELHLQLQSLDVESVNDLENAFKAATGSSANALVLLAGAPINDSLKQIADFAMKNRLPSIYDRSGFVEAGGLMSYGTNTADTSRRAVTYVDKILKGAKPADLPIEQPMKFELVINLKTAKQIRLAIPQSVLFRADKVIK